MNCYAVVRDGHYDFTLIKIDEKYKEKFIRFLEELEEICDDGYKLLAYIDVLELYGDELYENHMETVEEFKQRKVIDELNRIYDMKEMHYLYEQRDRFRELMYYDFK